MLPLAVETYKKLKDSIAAIKVKNLGAWNLLP
jgi:hypothetical protein